MTLFKWQLLCEANKPARPDIEECLSAALIATAARTGSSKALVMPIPNDHSGGTAGAAVVEAEARALHVWVLHNSIRYTSTEREGAVEAIKLLYRVIGLAEAEDMLEKVALDAHEISLPGAAVDAVLGALERSNALLPPAQRKFQQWTVGLLERGAGG